MTLEPEIRLTFLNQLPNQTESLRESVKIKRIRDKIQLTDEEKELLDIDEQTGSFDPTAVGKLDSVDIDLSASERELIAYTFVQKEQDGRVPTNDAFVELLQEFQEEIAAVKKEMGGDNDE